MSGPNTDYDPVEVTPLKAEEVEAMRDEALAAIAGAADLDELKQVASRPRRRPLADRARQPRDRCAAAPGPQGGRPAGRPGPRRGQPGAGRAQAVLEAEHEERMLVEETVDVTLPTDRRPAAPGTRSRPASELIADIFVAMGWEVAEGPVDRGRVAQLRRPQPRARPPGPHHAGHLLDRAGRRPRWCCAPTPRRSRRARC